MKPNEEVAIITDLNVRGREGSGVQLRFTHAPDKDADDDQKTQTPWMAMTSEHARDVARILLELADAVDTGSPLPASGGLVH